MLKTRSVILAKVESTYNTDPTPAAATDAVLVENIAISPEGVRMIERKVAKPTFGSIKSVYAGMLVSVKFDCEMKGSGTAGTAPEIAPLLKACALKETVVAATSVTYKPSSVDTDHKSITLYFYEDGLRYKITGARGKVTFSLQTGAAGKASFTFTGHLVGPSDVAIVSPTYNAQVPPPVINAPFAIDSYSAVIAKLDFDLGIELATPDNIAATDGYGEVRITDMNCSGSFDPEATLVATYDWITKWKSSGTYALTTGAVGATGGNKYTVSMPAVLYSEIGTADRSGILTRDVKFMAVESSTDDAVSIAFT